MLFARPLAPLVLCLLSLTALGPAQTDKTKPAKKPDDSVEELTKKARDLTHTVKMAELKLKIAEFDVQISDDGAEAAVRKAKHDLLLARSALTHFDAFVAPSRLAQAQIALDSAKNRAEQAKDEYNELVAMYKQEEFAEMTKELVLKRGRHSMDIAGRALKLQADKMNDLKKTVLPRERTVLAGKLDAADAAMAQGKLKQRKAMIQSQVTLAEAAHQLDSAKTDLEEVRTKLSKSVKK